MSPNQAVCPVCENPRSSSLTPGQIRWHNHDHPAPSTRRGKIPVAAQRTGTPVMVVLRPGDRLIYETSPNRYEEIDVNGLVARIPSNAIVETCKRCLRRVVSADPPDRSLMTRIRRLFSSSSR